MNSWWRYLIRPKDALWEGSDLTKASKCLYVIFSTWGTSLQFTGTASNSFRISFLSGALKFVGIIYEFYSIITSTTFPASSMVIGSIMVVSFSGIEDFYATLLISDGEVMGSFSIGIGIYFCTGVT